MDIILNRKGRLLLKLEKRMVLLQREWTRVLKRKSRVFKVEKWK